MKIIIGVTFIFIAFLILMSIDMRIMFAVFLLSIGKDFLRMK